MNRNIYAAFAAVFDHAPERLFIENDDGRQFTYADVARESGRYAALFQALGLAPGDRVLVQTEKSPEVIFAYLGCLRAGLIYLPLNPAFQTRELEYFLDDAQPSAVIASDAALPTLGELAASRGIAHRWTLNGDGSGTLAAAAREHGEAATVIRDADDCAVILYTSGTTGKPKGAMLTHANLAANANALQQAWQWRRDDVLLHSLPIFHIHGLLVGCHCVLIAGASMLFLSQFETEAVIRLLPRVTVFMGVPTYYTRLLEQSSLTRETARNMRLFISGSAPLAAATFDEFEARTGHCILERYGMTETGMNLSNPLEGPRIPGTVGQPLPGVTASIVDDQGQPVADGAIGELLVRGDNVFAGYWRKPEKTAEDFTADGFFRTGDLATRDKNGYYAIVGRGKDLIISGGFNVYPKEVETCLDEVEGIKESAVIGLEHPDFGEGVVAICVPAANTTPPAEDELIAMLKAEIANYKVPKRVVFVDELPRNAMGKVQKAELRARFTNEIRF